MTTPTTMTTSMITTATTMMTVVVVAPSLWGLLVGGVLLPTAAVPVVVIVPLLWIGEDTPTVWEVVGIDAVERKYTRCHFTWIETQSTEIGK